MSLEVLCCTHTGTSSRTFVGFRVSTSRSEARGKEREEPSFVLANANRKTQRGGLGTWTPGMDGMGRDGVLPLALASRSALRYLPAALLELRPPPSASISRCDLLRATLDRRMGATSRQACTSPYLPVPPRHDRHQIDQSSPIPYPISSRARKQRLELGSRAYLPASSCAHLRLPCLPGGGKRSKLSWRVRASSCGRLQRNLPPHDTAVRSTQNLR